MLSSILSFFFFKSHKKKKRHSIARFAHSDTTHWLKMETINFHPENRKFRVNLLIDWSRSFVDENGSFSSNTTEHAKDLAVDVIKRCDMIIYMTDIHTANSYEFQINGIFSPFHTSLPLIPIFHCYHFLFLPLFSSSFYYFYFLCFLLNQHLK